MNRRDFLVRTGGVGSAALIGMFDRAVPPMAPGYDSRFTIHNSREQLTRIGVQLYTVRAEMRASVAKTVEQVARIGYKEVEFAGYFDHSAKDIRALLDANGLTSPSAHSASMPAIRNRLPQLLEDAATMGQRYVICASVPSAEQTLDGYRRIAAEFNRAGELAAKSGIKVGFHNHSDDHAPLGDTAGFDILLAECDPKVTTMQMDLFWTVKGGKDPLAYFAKYPGRFSSVHVKDMTAGGAMVDVGAGEMPFAKYFAQSKQAGIQHYFVEHDGPKDPMTSLVASYKYLSALKF